MRALGVLMLLMPLAAFAMQRTDSPACNDPRACRQLALDAAAQRDFETFQHFAWRALQAGRSNDPESIYLVAQAQALNGRPHDSLVMLRRLADMGVAASAAETGDEFRGMRTLPEWPSVQAAIQAAARTGRALTIDYTLPILEGATTTVPITSSAPATALSVGTRPDADRVTRRAPIPLTAIAMAYDAVSARFVLADERTDTLKVLDDLANNVVDLVGPGWAGIYESSALAIDGRRGDLWVVGAQREGSTSATKSALHRLQLISGRLLSTVPLPEESGAARFTDIAVTQDGQVLVLDSEGQRIYRGGVGSKTLTLQMKLDVPSPTSLAVAGDGIIYVAHAGGIVRVNLNARTSVALTTEREVNVAHLQRIAFYNNSLLGIQKGSDEALHAVRITLDKVGLRATRLEVIEAASSRAASLSNGVFYFLGGTATKGSIVRRINLR